MTGCNSIIPENNNGEQEQGKTTVLVELFIAENCPYCKVVEPIIENLAKQYTPEEMILVEMVLDGSYFIPESRQRYDWYDFAIGVPQMMLNGLNSAIKGVAYSSEIKNAIEKELNKNPAIFLEASRTTDSTGTAITGKIKNISTSTLTNLVVNGMAFKDRGSTGFRYNVTDIFEDEKQSISSIAPGEEKEFTITVSSYNWDAQNLDGVIFVQSITDPKKTILQSVFLD